MLYPVELRPQIKVRNVLSAYIRSRIATKRGEDSTTGAWRRGRDLNPRTLSGNTLSKRAH